MFHRVLTSGLCFFLCALLIPAPAVAQEVPDFFEGAAMGRSALRGVALERLETLEQNPPTQSVRLVRLAGNLSQRRALVMHVDRDARVLAPRVHPVFQRNPSDRTSEDASADRNATLFVRRDRIEALSEGAFAWTGTVRAGPGRQETVGKVIFVRGAKGNVTGTLRIETEYYLIRPLGGGLHALVEADESKYTPGGDSPLHSGGSSHAATPSPASPKPEVTPAPASLAASEQGCPVSSAPLFASVPAAGVPSAATPPCAQYGADVLVVYTADAAAGRDIDGIISVAVAEANAAYNNSDVGLDVDLNLVHSQQVGFSESGNIGNDLNSLVANGTIQSLRDQHHADVVVLLGEYGGAGLADELRAEAEDAYAIADVDDATGGAFVFTHEIGHLQGAQHHPGDPTCSLGDPDCDPEGHRFPDAYGHRFVDDPWWCLWPSCESNYATVMAYTQGGIYSRILHFSNPSVSYDGHATGTSARNNASALQTTANAVENFRTGDLRAFIQVLSGDPNDPMVSEYTFGADVCGGSGGYSYEWRISYHGPGNYGSVLGTQQTFSKSFPPGTHFVKLTVHSGDGQQDSDTQAIEFDPYPSGAATASATGEASQNLRPKNAGRASSPERLALRLAGPNPFRAATTLAYDLPERTDVELVVYDVMGRAVKRLTGGTYGAGTHRVRLDGTDLPSGVYVVRFTAGDRQITRRVTVVR